MALAEDQPFRWTVGMREVVDGLPMRVTAGRKDPQDLRLEWWTPDGWQPMTFRAAFIMCDFFFENEHVLYPPPRYKGGHYFLRHVQIACDRGWEAAWDRVLRDKRNKR